MRFLGISDSICIVAKDIELKRKINDKLIRWKNASDGHTALLIEGARRVGKTTAAEKFGRENYDSYVLIDFAKASKAIFDNFRDNLNDLDRFYQIISLEYNVRLFRRRSLIIFDEIQKFPRAREAIKYLVADGRYDFVETGSLISIHENVADILIPSEEERIRMYPLDFEEFMTAIGEEILLEYIRACFEKRVPLDNAYHKKASMCLREYLLVGGMPQSVAAYVEGGKDFHAADTEKRHILSLYRDDIRKAASKYKSRVSAIFENIPGFLSTHEKRVVINRLGISGNSDAYDDPLFWLGDSMICNLCYKCTDPNVGLALNKDESMVKCYMGDTGLLVSLAFSENEITANELYRSIMKGKLSLNEGMLHENLVAQMLVSKGKQLYFYTDYSAEKHRNEIEIDFLVSSESLTNTKVYPIEVKSSTNFTVTSYDRFRQRFGKRIGESYVISPKPFSIRDNGYYIPTYMMFCLF